MPRLGEDVRNVTLIVGSAAVALFATAALVAVAVHEPSIAPRVEVRVERLEARVVEAPRVVTSGAERLYGTVETLDGDRVEGFIRWDRNEGSWADLLDAIKSSGSGVATETGVRFGHIVRIEATGDRSAWIEMRSGEAFELQGQSTDLGTAMRGLTVQTNQGSTAHFEWDELASISLFQAPEGAQSSEQRLHGRLTTGSGLTFEGFVTWDIDEIYDSDVLDGESRGRDYEIPFGAIARLEPEGSRALRVELHDGEVVHLTGTNDVDSSNRGITVSDPGLGQIRVDFDDLASVEFFPAEAPLDLDDFDGGSRVYGTVTGSSGESWTGAVTWDRDEAWGWEILNGHLDDVEFFVEFGRVAQIRKDGDGAEITLRDGRRYHLRNSQDVNRGNRGIRVDGPDGSHSLRWSEFAELRLDD